MINTRGNLIAMRAAALAVALAVVSAGRVAVGQGTDPLRDPVAAFRDSVAAIGDTVELRTLESRLMAAARRDRSNAMLHVRLGVVADRLGASRDAAAEYKWATELEPSWPVPWFYWAMAELRLGDEVETAASNRRLVSARGAWARATRAVARAVEIDSSYAPIAAEQVALAIERGRADWGRVIRDGLRQGAVRAAAQPDVWLSLGRAERTLGDSAAAADAFEQASRFPTTRGIARLERARTLLTAGDDRGIEAYFDGSTTSDPEAVAQYRLDLALIAAPEELRRFDASSGVDRARTLWEVWTDRDRTELRQLGERLKEHYRRIAAARALYGNLDDLRAKVLIRQGDPDGRATLAEPGLPFNESWWYRRSDGDLAVHFVGPAAGSPAKLVESVFELGAGDPEARGPAADEPDPSGSVSPVAVLRSRARLSPFYQAAADADPGQLRAIRERERAFGRRAMERALSTDRFPLRFARELAGRVQIAALVSDGGARAITLAFAVPGFAASPRGGAGLALYPVRVRAVIRDSALAVVRAVDTVVVLERDIPVSAEERLLGRVEVPVESGRYAVSSAVEYDSAGMVASRDSVLVPSGGGSPLVLTDLLAVAEGSESEGGWAIDPAPVLERTDTLTLSAMVVGGTPGRARLRVLVRTAPAEGSDERWRPLPGASDWIPTDVVANGATPVRLLLPMRRLTRGGYELQVVIVDAVGATAWQYARFEVDDGS